MFYYYDFDLKNIIFFFEKYYIYENYKIYKNIVIIKKSKNSIIKNIELANLIK